MWRQYAHATGEFLKLQLDLYMATTARDWTKEDWLNDLIIGAQSERDIAHNTTLEHENVAHSMEIILQEDGRLFRFVCSFASLSALLLSARLPYAVRTPYARHCRASLTKCCRRLQVLDAD